MIKAVEKINRLRCRPSEEKKAMKKEVTETSKMKVKRERENESSDHRVDVLIILHERRRHSGSHR